MQNGGGPISGRARTILVVLTALSLAGLAAGATLQNDGGSGGDAGDTQDRAAKLGGFSTYSGDILSSDPADWYKVKLARNDSGPVCVETTVTATTASTDRLVAVVGDKVREVQAVSTTLNDAWIGIASPGLSGVFLGVAPSAAGSVFGYQFNLVRQADSMGDARSGRDAGASASGALPVPSGCVLGRLDPTVGDTTDVFSFAASTGDRLVLSVAQSAPGARFSLLDPSGVRIAELLPGTMAPVTLTVSGTYLLTATASEPVTYSMGMCEPRCGPPEDPCEPMCAVLMAQTS